MRPTKLKVLSDDELYSIHLRSVEVLEEVGVKIPSETALKLFDEVGAEVDYKNQIVRIPQYLIEECIRKTPHKVTLYGRKPNYKLVLEKGKVYFGTVGFATRIMDLETGEYRPLLQEDLAQITKIADAMENVDFQLIMGQPMDVPMEVSDLYQILIALQNTSKHRSGQALDREKAKIAIKMASLAAGGEEELKKKPIITLIICLNSPLYYDENLMEALIEASRFGLPVWSESGPMAGANAPVTLAGTIVLNNAEVLGALVLSKLVNPNSPFIYGSWARSIDMKSGSVVFGGPEFPLLKICTVQLAEYYKVPCGAGGVLCDSKTCDAQAGYEKMVTALIPALAGLNLVTGIGLVASESIASPQQIVIDDEICGIIKRLLEGVYVDEEALALDVIKEVGMEGNFISHKHTIKYALREHWLPKLSDRRSPDVWIEAGKKTAIERAKEIAKKVLETHQPEPLPKDIVEEMKKLVEELKKIQVK